ncbi:hypothetical protein [Chitinophaga sp.]|uniref:hypothetical protein n=1 Tax=Chitinophaga sp. TaxID=1869181 RepID=UPI002D80903C|nr:hypothetical protein [Chitinophaga sp.]
MRIINPGAAKRLRLLPVMHGLIGILFLFNAIGAYRGSAQPNWVLAGFFIILGIACLSFPFMMKRFKKFNEANSVARLVQVFVCLTASLYFLSHLQPITGLLLLIVGIGLAYIGWIEYKIFQPVSVKIDTTGITVPATFSPRLIGWNELNNVILRNDLLTIDFKNNRILQLEILDEPGQEKREELNAFFKSRII